MTLADRGEARAVLLPYVAVLAALGPAAVFLSDGLLGAYHPPTTIFNTTIPGGRISAPGSAALQAVLFYAFSVGAWRGLALALAKLGPPFGGLDDPRGANKAAAQTLTPLWAAGALLVLGSVPYLGFLAVLGLIAGVAYSVYVGMIAVPLHLGTPREKAPGHILAALGLTLVVGIGAYLATSAIVFSILSPA
jgi:hypothetical protein